jgi:hypothetical protein
VPYDDPGEAYMNHAGTPMGTSEKKSELDLNRLRLTNVELEALRTAAYYAKIAVDNARSARNQLEKRLEQADEELQKAIEAYAVLEKYE